MEQAGAKPDLRALCDRPFALLQEMERRRRDAASGIGPGTRDGTEVVGVGFRLAEDRLLALRSEVREILMLPGTLTRVPGARSWVRGLANVRGQLLPLLDLRDFLGAGPTPAGRNTRVLVTAGRDFPVGLMVDEVYGFRRFQTSEFETDSPETGVRCDRYLAGCYRRGGDAWPLFGLRALLESPALAKAAAD